MFLSPFNQSLEKIICLQVNNKMYPCCTQTTGNKMSKKPVKRLQWDAVSGFYIMADTCVQQPEPEPEPSTP